MGQVIDFKSYAARRAGEAERREKLGAPDYTKLYPPHSWPAGGNDAETGNGLAAVTKLAGNFGNDVLYAAIPKTNGYYHIAQFEPGTHPGNMDGARVIDYFHMPAGMMEAEFTPLTYLPPEILSHLFNQAAEPIASQLCVRAIAAVHVVSRSGLCAFDHDDTVRTYNAGDVIVEYKSGRYNCGPAAMILPHLVPLNQDAAQALALAANIATAARGPDADKFDF